MVLPPLVSRTPITRKGMFLIRIIWSTALPSGKRALATVAPSTATLAADLTSESPKKTPFSTFQERTNGHSTPTPWTEVPQLPVPPTIWPAERTEGDTYATAGHSALTAATSSSVI